MAVSELGRQLTASHYRQQVALRAATIKDLTKIYPSLDTSTFAALDKTWPPFEASARTLVRARYADSSGLSANYYNRFRRAEKVKGTATARLAAPLESDRLDVSLKVTGQFRARRLLATQAGDVSAQTLVSLAGSVSRLVLTGGRDTISASIKADPQALGFARVTSGRPCAFCALLAGRGAVYKQDTVDFEAHDHCSCSSEPVYSRDSALPGRGDEFRQLYSDAAKGETDPLKAFRKAYDAGTEEAAT